MFITCNEGSPLASFEASIYLTSAEEGKIYAGLYGYEEGRGKAEESQEISEWVGMFVLRQEETDRPFHWVVLG